MVLPGREKLTLSLKPAKEVWPGRGLPVQSPPIPRGGESRVGPGAAPPDLGLQNLLRGRSLLKAFICEMGSSTAVVPVSPRLVLGWPECLFRFVFRNILWKNPNALFVQPNRRPETFAKSRLRRLPGRRSQQSVQVTEGDLTERAP